jgi:hypothetical protein
MSNIFSNTLAQRPNDFHTSQFSPWQRGKFSRRFFGNGTSEESSFRLTPVHPAQRNEVIKKTLVNYLMH